MTRNPDRIDPIIELLREEWHEHPDQRLGQLITNACHPQHPFHVEDTEWAAALAEASGEDDPFDDDELEYFVGEGHPWDVIEAGDLQG